jgi:hypothetical protein
MGIADEGNFSSQVFPTGSVTPKAVHRDHESGLWPGYRRVPPSKSGLRSENDAGRGAEAPLYLSEEQQRLPQIPPFGLKPSVGMTRRNGALWRS